MSPDLWNEEHIAQLILGTTKTTDHEEVWLLFVTFVSFVVHSS